MDEVYDTAVIGGGPAGLSGAIYAARAGLKVLLIDGGGRAGALSSASKIENFPGLVRPHSGKEIISLFRRQAQLFGAEIFSGKVIDVELDRTVKKITAGDRSLLAKTVIIATGSMSHDAGIKGEKEFLGKGVGYCAVCDAPLMGGKDVAMVGNQDEIMSEIEIVKRFAKKTYVILPGHRKGNGDGENLFGEGAEVIEKHKLTEISGDRFVSQINIEDDSGKAREIPVSGVFIYLKGNRPSVDFISENINKEDNGCISADPVTMETSIPGVYAAGDVTCKEFRQAVVAASEGCRAALSAEGHLNKRKRPRNVWH